MRSSELSRFNKADLYAALDAQRRSHGISWQQAARQIGVAASTLTRTKQRGPMETDGMLAMVRWLGRTPESFMRVSPRTAPTAEFSEGHVGSSRSHRFDTKALYEELDERRRSREMTWKQVAREVGDRVAPRMLTRLAMGGRISVDLMISAVAWLGRTVESFTRDSEG